MSEARLTERITRILDPKFEQLKSLELSTYLFGYTVSSDNSYTVEGIAKKEGDLILIKKTSLSDFVPLPTLVSNKPSKIRQMLQWAWDCQHIFTEAPAAQGPTGYCWCGWHKDQHTQPCLDGMTWAQCQEKLGQDPVISRMYFKMREVEANLHTGGVCSNPSGCGYSS